MEQRATAFEEELAVPEHGTAATSGGEVVVGCPSRGPYGAEVTVLLASGKSHVVDGLRPGQSIRIDSTECSYLIVLLSLVEGGIRVRIVREQIERKRTAEAPPSLVQVVETETSCFAALQRIIDEALSGKKTKSKCDHNGFRIFEKGLLGKDLIKISGAHVQIFYNARWSDLKIDVFAESYLASAQAIADSYSLRTGARATIYKQF